MTHVASDGPSQGLPRLNRLDALRGIAVLAMVVFHSVWDLGYFGLIAADIPDHPAFRMYGHVIAAGFLMVAGMSLVLADRGRRDQPVLSARQIRRFGILALAAATITIVTFFAMPDAFIFFGILHCILLSSLLAVPFLRRPVRFNLGLALVALSLPLMRSAINLDAHGLIWLGLSQTVPTTSDWRPLFPWSGFLFLGVVIGRLIELRQNVLAFLYPAPRSNFSKWLQQAGRNSLAIYMLHQPILLLIFFALSQAIGVHVETDGEAFVRACETKCGVSSERGFCTRVCTCIVDVAQKQPLWKDVVANRLTPDQTTVFNGIASQCVRQLQPPAAPLP